MAIAILAVICGAETWVDMEDFGVARYDWLKRFLELPNGIPSHDTFNRVFSLIDPKVFETRFVAWVEAVSGKLNGQVVIDGKMIKGSGNRRAKKEPLWIVSIDAMGCQKEITKKIQDAGGEYVLAVKGNLHDEISNYFEQAEAVTFEYVTHDFHRSIEESRCRVEERLLYVTDDIDWLPMRDARLS